MPARHGSLEYWKEEIRRAKLYQNARNRLDRWKQYRQWYRNEYPEQQVTVNKIFGVGRAMVPQLYFKAPTMLVRPRKPNMGQQAKVLEAVDSVLIEQMGVKMQVKMAILDAYLTNIGVLKAGFHSIGTELPNPPDENDTALAEMLSSLESSASPGEADDRANAPGTTHDYVRPDSPWLLRIKPEDLLVPWGYVDEHEVPWCAFRIRRPLADIKKDPVYKNLANLKANLQIEITPSGVKSPNMLGFAGTTADFVELFEIWDKRDGTIKVLSEDHDRWLRHEKHGLEIRGIPAVVLRFNPDGVDFWGISDVEQIRKQQNELNENRTHEIESKRIANVKGILDKTILDPDEITKIQGGKPGILVLANGPPANSFTDFQVGRIPTDFFKVDEIIEKDIREIVGFSRNQVGEFQSSRTTATEANIVQSANELRSDERRDLVADLLVEAFRDKIHPLIFQNWTTQRVVEVTALGGWIEYTGPQIRGDYNIACVADSALPLSRAQEQQMSVAAFNMFRGDIRVRQRELYARVAQAFSQIFPDAEHLLLSDEEVTQLQQQQAMASGPQAPPGAKPTPIRKAG